MQNFNLSSIFRIQSFSLGGIEAWYVNFLSQFSPTFGSVVSLILALVIIYSAFRFIKKDFIFIIALIILVPGSVPILQSIWFGLVELIKFLFHVGR